MRTNTVKRTLRGGGVSLGTMVFEFSTTGIGRIAATAAAEFVVFDMEHTGWSLETIRMLLATSRAADLVPIVRVPATQYHFLARTLDVGALGLMVPMVESAEQAQLIVQSSRYPPLGRRGAAFGVAHDDYEAGDLAAKMRNANEEVLLIAQVETAAGVDRVDDIAAVDGIDVLWVGQFDLVNSLGIPGQFSHPLLQSAIDRILAACRRYNKVPAVLVGSVEEGRAMLAQGFRCLAYGGDIWLYQAALRQGIAALRALPEAQQRT
jgi:2-dehydro-3-deoxyglucarate aldolase/4-hydroxy-2-oxoheptanedioate aldolase